MVSSGRTLCELRSRLGGTKLDGKRRTKVHSIWTESKRETYLARLVVGREQKPELVSNFAKREPIGLS